MRERARLDRRAVVAEAARLADERGLGGVTLGEVAQRLGVRTPSLYNHIAGQDDLLRELAVEAARQLYAAFVDASVGRAGPDAVRALARAYRAFAKAHPGLYPALARAPAAGDVEAEAAARAIVDIVARVVAGLEPGDDAVHAVRAIRSALHGFVALEAAGGFGLPASVDASYERLVEVLIAGLASAPGAAPPPRRRSR